MAKGTDLPLPTCIIDKLKALLHGWDGDYSLESDDGYYFLILTMDLKAGIDGWEVEQLKNLLNVKSKWIYIYTAPSLKGIGDVLSLHIKINKKDFDRV